LHTYLVVSSADQSMQTDQNCFRLAVQF
jgi:hypothetical protein